MDDGAYLFRQVVEHPDVMVTDKDMYFYTSVR